MCIATKHNVVCSPVAVVGTDQPNYTTPEDVAQLEVSITFISGQKAPGRECLITVTTADGSAVCELLMVTSVIVWIPS